MRSTLVIGGLIALALAGASVAALVDRPDGSCGPLPSRGPEPEGADALCDLAVARVHARYPAVGLEDLWVEWTSDVRTPSVPGGDVAGSIRGEAPWPWVDRLVLVVSVVDSAGREWTAADSALVHELVLHALSERLGRGRNAQHSDVELERLMVEIVSLRQ